MRGKKYVVEHKNRKKQENGRKGRERYHTLLYIYVRAREGEGRGEVGERKSVEAKEGKGKQGFKACYPIGSIYFLRPQMAQMEIFVIISASMPSADENVLL